mmetsp:Transcript_98954/g.283056  ORF Transcript_98954/g.283056 Transcript_98954/m.283056 type:complete len:201 (+) Transcript_98954:174-776(+)
MVSFTKRFLASGSVRAWFLNTTSSFHLRLTCELLVAPSIRGLPSSAASLAVFSAIAASSASFSNRTFSRSALIFSSSRCNSSSSSSSSSSLLLSRSESSSSSSSSPSSYFRLIRSVSTSSALSIRGFAPPSTVELELSSSALRFFALSFPSRALSSADSSSSRVTKSGICSPCRILSFVCPGMSLTLNCPDTFPPSDQLP